MFVCERDLGEVNRTQYKYLGQHVYTIYNYPTVTLSIECEKYCVYEYSTYTVAGSHIAQL